MGMGICEAQVGPMIHRSGSGKVREGWLGCLRWLSPIESDALIRRLVPGEGGEVLPEKRKSAGELLQHPFLASLFQENKKVM